jgi:hypothetical protein
MANTVIALKKSATPSSVPVDLANGELAINYADGKLYYKAANGSIASISGNEPNFFGSVNANNSLIVADTPGDILTIAAGPNIFINSDPVNDIITISASFDAGDPSFAFNHANAAYAKANVANITADLAFNHANAAFDAANNAVTDFSPAFNQANDAYLQANSAYFQANSAFDKANIPPVVVSNTTPTSPEPNTLWWNSQLGRMFIYYQDNDSTQWIEATPGGIKAEDLENASRHANLAFNQANTGRTHANASYAFANSAHAIANAAYSHANVIYDFANSAHAIANIAFTHANNAYNEANTVNIYSDSTYVKLTAPSQTVTGDFAIVGSLSVSGNTYIVNSESLRVADPLLYLAGNNYTSDIVDIGFIANYVNATGQNVHTGLYREHENKEYYLFQGYDAEPINNHIGPMSNNMTLAVLNADIKTSNITLGGVNAISRIDASHNQANAAYDKANSVIEAGYYAGNNGEVGRAAGLGDIFRVHTNILTANVTIYSGNNAMAAGPITVASGRVFTIQANARVAIV